MEALRSAANAAANLVGYDTTAQSEQNTGTNNISGGEAPQNVEHSNLTSQSGIEPVSGKLGRGEAGAPYDAGNDQGLTDSYAQDTTSARQTGTGLTSGLGSNTYTSSSGTLTEKAASSLGLGGDDTSRGLGSRSGGPGSGSGSRHDASRLGSTIGHGTSSEKHLYNSKNAPGLGGSRVGDDFSDANTRHEGANKLPAVLGSDAAAGHSSGGGIGSGLSSGNSRSSKLDSSKTDGLLLVGNNNGRTTGPTSDSGLNSSSELGTRATDGIANTLRYGDKTENTHSADIPISGTRSGTSETLTRKAEDHLPGANTTTSGPISPTNNSYKATGTSAYAQGTGLTGAGTGLTGSGNGLVGSNVGGNVPRYGGNRSGYTDEVDDGCEASTGHKPHGGHPIGEEAHKQGQGTWLDYRNDSSLPIGRAKPE